MAEASRSRGKGIPSADYADDRSVTVLAQAQRIAAVALDKLAEDVVILDMREMCSFTDYFVIATGRNTRQVKGIHDEILVKLKQEERLIARGIAGEREADWIVIDYVDIVVHVFTPEQRSFYRLEDLWADVPRVEVDAVTTA